MVAGTRFFGLYIAVRRSRRASGTFEMPIVASAFPVRGPRGLSGAGHELKKSGFAGCREANERRSEHGLNRAS